MNEHERNEFFKGCKLINKKRLKSDLQLPVDLGLPNPFFNFTIFYWSDSITRMFTRTFIG